MAGSRNSGSGHEEAGSSSPQGMAFDKVLHHYESMTCHIAPSLGGLEANRKRRRDGDSPSGTSDVVSGQGDQNQAPRKKRIIRASTKLHKEQENGEPSEKPTSGSPKKSRGNGNESSDCIAFQKTNKQTATKKLFRPNATSSALNEILSHPPLNFENTEDNTNTQALIPEKVLIDESQIDLTWTEVDPPNLVRRSQKQLPAKEIARRLKEERKGTDRKPMGEIKPLLNGEGWAFKDIDNPEWTKAEYHYRLRDRFILEDAIAHPPYQVQPQKGLGRSDITSHCTNQVQWTSNTDTVRDPQGRNLLVNDFQRNENTVKDPDDWVLQDGTVVIDVNGHAVKWFDGIPKAMSSQIEPWRVEGMRAFNSMKVTE